MKDESQVSDWSDQACPSQEELVAALEVEDSSVSEHVARCLRCRARYESLACSEDGEMALVHAPSASTVPIRDQPHRVRPDSKLDFGTICSIASDDRPGERLLVVVLGGPPVKDPQANGAVTVAPISIERAYAAGWDALVDQNESALAYDSMVELWNYGRVSRAQLDEVFGTVYAAARTRLEHTWKAMRENAEAAPTGARVGPTIVGDLDHRIGFQRDEIGRAAAFFNPWVDHVIELSGSLIRILRDRAAGSQIAVAEGSPEAIVLNGIRGGGFITPPHPHHLGRVIRLLDVDVDTNTEAGRALDEEASAWVENDSQSSMQLAARGLFARTRGAVGRVIPALADKEPRRDEVETYVAAVREAARTGADDKG
jgi:hypothetical protein